MVVRLALRLLLIEQLLLGVMHLLDEIAHAHARHAHALLLRFALLLRLARSHQCHHVADGLRRGGPCGWRRARA